MLASKVRAATNPETGMKTVVKKSCDKLRVKQSEK